MLTQEIPQQKHIVGICFFCLFLLLPIQLDGQTVKIIGQLWDETEKAGMEASTVQIQSLSDTTQVSGAVTDSMGRFIVLMPAAWLPAQLTVNETGFKAFSQVINPVSAPSNLEILVDLGRLAIQNETVKLDEIRVETQQVRAVQSGDTTTFNAAAYKTNPDATVQDLITKLPGVTTQNGQLNINGEQVKRVLVDGKPFMGDDPNMALKNLPADVVSRVQVLDRQTDQAQASGIFDGNTEKTVNIITKSGLVKGQFGRIYGGVGTDENPTLRWLGGGNANYFKGVRRFSVLGLTNNINQQNFDSQDLFGGSGPPRPGGRGGNRGGAGVNDPTGFIVPQQNGIATNHALGLNYADEFGKKVKLAASYFVNRNQIENMAEVARSFTGGGTTGQTYLENQAAQTLNWNQRFNARLEYKPDTVHQLLVNTRFNWQSTNATSQSLANTSSIEQLLSQTANSNGFTNIGYSGTLEGIYSYVFKKPERKLSISGELNLSNRAGTTNLLARNRFFLTNDSVNLNQNGDNFLTNQTVNLNATFSEPLTPKHVLQFTYNPTFNCYATDKFIYNRSPFSLVETLDTALTNQFSNRYTTHRTSLGWVFKTDKWTINLAAIGQYADLSGRQVFPALEIPDFQRQFVNFLPLIWLNYKPNKNANLRVVYRTSTIAPAVGQLQGVVTNSNPILLTAGNPNLDQSYNHYIVTRYWTTNTEKGTGLYGFALLNYRTDHIANATFIPVTQDSLVSNGIRLPVGAQLTKPVNLDGYIDSRASLTHSFTLKPIKSNVSFGGSVAFNQTPGQINGLTNYTQTTTVGFNPSMSSNISPQIDFTLGYQGSYSWVRNELNPGLNTNYLIHTANARVFWNFWKGLFIESQLSHSLFYGLGEGFDRSWQLLSAGVGYKLLPARTLELKFSAYDILNQNTAIQRQVTETYIEDQRNTALTRFFMVTLTYTLRKLSSGSEPPVPADPRPGSGRVELPPHNPR
jgi:hypothetical protein